MERNRQISLAFAVLALIISVVVLLGSMIMMPPALVSLPPVEVSHRPASLGPSFDPAAFAAAIQFACMQAPTDADECMQRARSDLRHMVNQ